MKSRTWTKVAFGLALVPAIAQLEARLAAAPPKISAVRSQEPDGKELLVQARAALKAGDYTTAERLAKQAQGMKVGQNFWDTDTPDNVLADVAAVKARSIPNADPKVLLKMSRDALAQGKYDDAQALAGKAAASNVNWGVFGDTPTKCIADITTAHDKANRAEAVKLLVEARKLFDQNNFDESERIAMRAARLHGPYSMMDLGDKPQRLLDDIQTAKAKGRKTVVPPAAVVKTPLANDRRMPPPPDWGEVKPAVAHDVKPADIRQVSNTTPAKPQQSTANNVGQTLLDKAKLEMQANQFETARQLAIEAHNGPYNCQVDAANVLRSIDAAENQRKTAMAMKAYEAGIAAVNGQDFVHALAILREVDSACLPADYQTQVGELIKQCTQKTNAIVAVPAVETPSLTPPPAAIVPDANSGATLTYPTKSNSAPTSAPAGETLIDQMKALNKIEFQRLREEGQKAQAEANKLFQRGETDTSLEMLQDYLKKVKASALDPNEINLLSRAPEQRLAMLKNIKTSKDSETNIAGRKSRHDAEMGRTALAEQKKQEQIKDLIKKYDQFVKEGRTREAALYAAKAKELNPEDPALVALDRTAQANFALSDSGKVEKNKQDMFRQGITDAENPGAYVNSQNPVHIDPVILQRANDRSIGIDSIRRKRSDVEKEIEHKMSNCVDLSFTNSPLDQVISDLRIMTGINITADKLALEEERIPLDSPVTERLDKIQLKSGLKVILDKLRLTYVIEDDVLKVTTARAARGKSVQKVYRVADLVMPVEDFRQPDAMNLERSLQRVIEQQQLRMPFGQTPSNNGRYMLQNGENTATGAAMTTAPGNGTATGMSQNGSITTTKQTVHEMLIKLIQNTVQPGTWSDVGGVGTIDYMPIGMALVINQTPDVQEQVQDLLEALRRLQDLQVAVEIKLITLSETFFERIGLDFNLNLKTDHATKNFESQLTTNQFKPPGQVNDFSPNRFIAGLNPAGSQSSPGSFTSDLDIPIKSSSFQYALPPFAYPNNPGFDGGLSMGLAFLSDIQVYMFMEAAQGDRRIHVMQAPKLTLFNGQSASISVQDQQFFVTNVGIVGFGGQVVFTPQNNPFPLGVEMTLQAVCSADRRFVRINTNVRLANLASTNVPLFPVTTFITPVFEGGAQGQPIPFTQFIQQPQLSLVNIQTTVSIPDGGTVILGGLKTLSEGRNEFGPPVLSKVPYVNRLFRNTGFGREAQSLLVMVTPRIIINAEEEERQTGVRSVQEQ